MASPTPAESEHTASDSLIGEESTGPATSTTSLDVSIAGLDLSLDVTAIDSGVEGPTAFIVWGVHGDEVAGYRAAQQIHDWTPDAGRLVVLPKANPLAIAHQSRTTEYGDLNRHFLAEQGPVTPLAQTVWNIVEQPQPDLVLSLHEARGIHDESTSVGQAIFHSPTDTARAAARVGINRANRTIRRRHLMFDRGHITPPEISPTGLLTEKATYDAEIPSFIVETYEDVSLDARIRWQKRITRGILADFDLYE